jgi:hypothetical protein
MDVENLIKLLQDSVNQVGGKNLPVVVTDINRGEGYYNSICNVEYCDISGQDKQIIFLTILTDPKKDVKITAKKLLKKLENVHDKGSVTASWDYSDCNAITGVYLDDQQIVLSIW